MSKITLFIIIIFMVLWLYYVVRQKEQYENTKNITNINTLNKSHEIINNPKKNIIKMPKKKCVVKQKTNFMTRNEIVDGHMEICPIEAQSIKQFNKDFFDFRGKTHNNSSIVFDAVDKVTELILNGGIWTPPVGEEVAKISDIYDKLTQRPDFQSECTRIPNFDSVMYDGYQPKILTGLYSSGNEWVYNKEAEINGGQLEKRLYSNDPAFKGDQYPLSAFPPMEPESWSG